MSKNAKTWLIILAVVLFLCLVAPETMKGIFLLLIFPIGLFLFMSLIGGIQSAAEKHSDNKYKAEEKNRDDHAISALKYHSIQSHGEYHNGWARVKIAEHRYTYVKNVDGRDVFIKPDSRFIESYDSQLGRNVITEYTDSPRANYFENAEEFFFQSAIVERDRKVALLGVDGQYVFPFDYGEGETISSSFDKLGDNCLVYYRLFNHGNSEKKFINRDGKVLYDGFARNSKVENGHLVIWEGSYRQEIDLATAKVVFPFCLTHFDFENGAKLVFSRRNESGWNVYDPSRQRLLFERNYGSIIYLNKRDAYLAIDKEKIRIANADGEILREIPALDIKYIYDQSYFYGEHCLYNFDGKVILDLSKHIRRVIHDETVPRDTIWWSTYINPRDTPKEPPFEKLNRGKILFFIREANFWESVVDLNGNTIIDYINGTIDEEYDPETNRLSGFAYYLPWSKTWAHCDLNGNKICENKSLPSRKREANERPVSRIGKIPTIPTISTNSITEVKVKRLLFFDTETTGLPRNYNAPVTDLGNWPRLVQLSWIVTDANGEELKVKDFIIKPDGFTIPEESSRVHGITTEIANRDGSPLKTVIEDFISDLETVDMIVGHNVEFDKKIVGAELLRCNIQSGSLDKRTVCTMKTSTNYCALPGKYGYKWPTLQELHNKLFGESFDDAHNSLNDIKATKKCYFELKNRRII